MNLQADQKRILLVSIINNVMSDKAVYADLKELKSLAEASGGKVIDLVIQKREIHDKGLYIGRGKIKEIATIIKKKDIQVVILNAIVKPGHKFEIANILLQTKQSVIVWDKVDLILDIFSRHAHTAEARMQIELAEMRHMGPRIYGMGKVMSRQGGGIGTLGVGETNTELMKRHWQSQMKKVQERLHKLSLERVRQLERRKKVGFQTVSLIGYTNAGKTSLFNRLTGKKKLVNNALFVTLDSSVGKVKLPVSKQNILLSDTIGFIKDLPPDLIQAFQSTLMESIHSDLLIHVIDSSDNAMQRKIAAVENVLTNLQLRNKKRMYIFNKSETLDPLDKTFIKNQYADFYPQFISVKENLGIDSVLSYIESCLSDAISLPLRKRKKIHLE